MVDLKLLAKGGLIVLVIIAIAILIEQLTWSGGRWYDEFDDLDNDVLPFNDTVWPLMNNTDDSIYNKSFVKCLLEHSKSSYYPITQGRNLSISCVPSGRCMHNFLIHSTKVLKSLNLKLILIEPLLLFCLLPSSRKYNLFTRGFTSTDYKGSKNVVTFGIESSQAKILDEVRTQKRLVSFGYRLLRLPVKVDSTHLNGSVSHYFIRRYDMVIHLIVLHQREAYLFSPAFDSGEINVRLQYVQDQAFENFTTSTSYLDAASKASILLPSDSRCFLLDVISSRFLECKVPSIDLTLHRNSEVLMALKELKSVLASQMIIFWLWSRSLQGWYERCDFQHYSTELKFSVAAKSVSGFNFPALFANSSCQHIETYYDATNNINSVQLSCFDVKIHLIFMFEDKITYWTEHIDAENIYKLRFPKFSLCSTDMYGEKISVPCETREILESDYGQFLKNTTLKLNPDSMKNVMLLMKRR